MSGTATVALLIGGVGAVCMLALLARLWSIGGGGEAPLGPLHPPRPDAQAPAPVPADFRVLIAGEATRWKRTDWQAVLARLERLAATFDAGPPTAPPPRRFSAEWLDARVQQIERHAGGPRTSIVPEPPGEAATGTSR